VVRFASRIRSVIAPNLWETTEPICFFVTRRVDGEIPEAVIEALPPAGLIVNADLSHYMEARDLAGTNTHRFDLVSIYCNISKYAIQ
jgi:hypothetical protein